MGYEFRSVKVYGVWIPVDKVVPDWVCKLVDCGENAKYFDEYMETDREWREENPVEAEKYPPMTRNDCVMQGLSDMAGHCIHPFEDGVSIAYIRDEALIFGIELESHSIKPSKMKTGNLLYRDDSPDTKAVDKWLEKVGCPDKASEFEYSWAG